MTLSETIVVVAIVGLLAILFIGIILPRFQIGKGRDSRRKADLRKIETGLEDYAGDHPCYPETLYNPDLSCAPAEDFKQYLNPIPCDPETQKPYVYLRPDGCKQFAVYAALENKQGEDYGAGYNYVVASSNLGTVSPVAYTETVGSESLYDQLSDPAHTYICISTDDCVLITPTYWETYNSRGMTVNYSICSDLDCCGGQCLPGDVWTPKLN